VAAAIGAMTPDTAPADVIRELRSAVAAFAEGAEARGRPHLLVLRWRGA
jgi:hypothetical protein